ncbi:hypothetical protein QL285_011169 [Trifolium repens]|nr:hypothetical protein QL285_011169 [Trifolium repens]
MANTTTALFVLILLIVTTLNGFNVEGATRGNQQKKDDIIYKSDKTFGCAYWYYSCMFLHIYCDEYNKYCAPPTTNAPPTPPAPTTNAPPTPNGPPIDIPPTPPAPGQNIPPIPTAPGTEVPPTPKAPGNDDVPLPPTPAESDNPTDESFP